MKARSVGAMVVAALAAGALLAGCGQGAASPTPTATAVPVATPASPLEPVTVSFSTEDRVTLQGRLFGQGATGVVLAHMFPADQDSWMSFAGLLAMKGYRVLTFNFRGYPPSQGQKEIDRIDRDVEAATRYLESQGVQKVWLVGASMGGTASIKAAARHPVAGVITLSAPEEFGGLQALEDAARVQAPKLFIASEVDTAAHRSAADLFERATAPRLLKVYRGDRHGTDLLSGEDGADVASTIVEFIQTFTPE
ncbi:MAG: alpha/beta fold hydrolase [Chloroflexi bacterium]|nr:alpha/beta fold hydrolase [Chloroflexota bacterium]